MQPRDWQCVVCGRKRKKRNPSTHPPQPPRHDTALMHIVYSILCLRPRPRGREAYENCAVQYQSIYQISALGLSRCNQPQLHAKCGGVPDVPLSIYLYTTSCGRWVDFHVSVEYKKERSLPNVPHCSARGCGERWLCRTVQ